MVVFPNRMEIRCFDLMEQEGQKLCVGWLYEQLDIFDYRGYTACLT